MHGSTSDPNYLQSDNHPDLSNGEPQRTLPAFQQSLCETIRTVTAKMDQGKDLESAKRDISLTEISHILSHVKISHVKSICGIGTLHM